MIKTALQFSHQRILKENKEHYLFNRILVYEKDYLPNNINANKAITTIEKKIPEFCFQYIDDIFIGDFEEFRKNNTNAFYSDGAIYITNNQSSEKDLIDDIIHELGHSLEEVYKIDIYGDKKIIDEFLSKRKQLFNRLSKYNSQLKKRLPLSIADFLNINYNEKLDYELYNDWGYDLLFGLSKDIFISPYAITSIREYFANGFENYYCHDSILVKKISPNLFEKIEEIDTIARNS